jgi:hypothetical protein
MLGVGVMLMVIAHQAWLWARGWQFNTLSPYFLVDFLIFSLIGLGSLVEPLPASLPDPRRYSSAYSSCLA